MFYKLLKENKYDLLILYFDCQKNQPLPKLPDQSNYYNRQLYLNNFCVEILRPNLPKTMSPVSYTHLDVYKRQLNQLIIMFTYLARSSSGGNPFSYSEFTSTENEVMLTHI